MDSFKKALTALCDIGGLKCSCCNPSKGCRTNTGRKRLMVKAMTRAARTAVKRETRAMINDC